MLLLNHTGLPFQFLKTMAINLKNIVNVVYTHFDGVVSNVFIISDSPAASPSKGRFFRCRAVNTGTLPDWRSDNVCAKGTQRSFGHPGFLSKYIFVCTLLLLSSSHQMLAQNKGLTFKNVEDQFVKLTETNLPDFSPEEFQKIRFRISDLRSKILKGIKIPDSTLLALQSDLKNFRSIATKTSKCLKKAYPLRQIAAQNDFVRAYNPASFYSADSKYRKARNYANNKDYAKSKIHAKEAANDYKVLIKAAQKQLKARYKPVLENYRTIINQDLKALKAAPNNSDEIETANSITQRVNLDNFGLGVRPDDLQPPIFPPPPAPPGPIPPDAVIIDARFADSIRIAWFDKSDNETGNLVVRYSTIGEEIVLANLGPFEKFEKHYYTDTFDIDPETRYCYKIVSFNDEGSRATNATCIYSASNEKIPALRLRVRITVDDENEADCDCTLSVALGQWIEGFGSLTFLNYSHDDFEEGSVFTYDLNIGDIKNLFDITEIQISNKQDGSGSEDQVKISKVEFLVNWKNHFRDGGELESDSNDFHKFFEQEWEGESKWLGTVTFKLNEIRSNPEWLKYTTSFRNTTNAVLISTMFPIHRVERDTFEIFIPKSEIVSRIESIVGHNGERGIEYETDHGMETFNLEWKDRFTSKDITVKNSSTIQFSLRLNPYNLGDATDTRLVSMLKDAIPGPFTIDGEIILSLTLDTLLEARDTVINNVSQKDTTIIFLLGGSAKVDNIKIDGRPSIGATILTGFLFRGKGLGMFLANPIFDFVVDCIALDGIPKKIERVFDPPIEIGRARKANIENILFNPDEIRVFFDADGNLHVCCAEMN